MRMRVVLVAVVAALFAEMAQADDTPHLTIRDHKFQPERLEVPAGVKFRLSVKNDDPTAEEFESFELRHAGSAPPAPHA